MSNPTTPFGWQMPTNTDLVTNLPADFEVFGQAVASSMADLLGGTSGQILAKNSNTDMDFTWVSANPGDITGVTAGIGISGGGTSGDVTVTNSMATAIDAKGDLIAGTAADAFSRLAVGTNGQILTADSTAATGMKWATTAGGGKVLQVVSTNWTSSFSTTSASYVDVTSGSLTITPTSATSKILFIGSWYAQGQGSNDQNGGDLQVLRGATVIVNPGLVYHLLGGNSQPYSTRAAIGSHYLDSPATTSATTYKIQVRQYNGTVTLPLGGVITLMEIGA